MISLLSEEAKAVVQKLQVDLKDAIRQLEETQYDQYISDQKKLLDELYEEYSLVLNQRLDNVDALIEETIATINANTDSINATITEAGNDVGYTISENLKTVWDGSTDSIEGTISVYGDGFNEKLTSINSVLNGIQDLVSSMVDLGKEEANEIIESTSNTTSPQSSTVQNTSNYEDSVVLETKPQQIATTEPKSDPKPKAPPAQHQHSYTISKTVEPTTTAQGYTEWKCSCGDTLRSNYKPKLPNRAASVLDRDILRFASGGLADFTGLAQLDGTKQKPELVLNPQDTQNFLALKETLQKMTRQELTLQSGSNVYQAVTPVKFTGLLDDSQIMKHILSQNPANSTQHTMGDINITIPIEHVQDYNDFVYKLLHDHTFEKAIQSMTVDRLVGGSALEKYKYSSHVQRRN